jgi:chromosome condensin MukBEF complex kleisin-like MukF subunit
MSSKLRLDNLPVDEEMLDDDFYDQVSVTQERHKPAKNKRRKATEAFNDYTRERSLKRRHSEMYSS